MTVLKGQVRYFTLKSLFLLLFFSDEIERLRLKFGTHQVV